MRPVPQVEKLLPRGTCRHETTGGAKQKGEDIHILPQSETGSGGASTGKGSGDSAGDPNHGAYNQPCKLGLERLSAAWVSAASPATADSNEARVGV